MVYFLSDAHIGSRAMEDPQHQLRFVELLETLAQDATAIYLLGDIFDFWSEYVWPDKSKEEYKPLLDCLKGLTDKGIEVHYFIGNHDIWTYGELAKRTGVIVHRKAEEMEIAGKRCLLAHGDGLVPSNYLEHFPKEVQKKIRSFMRLRRLFHNPVAQFLFRLLPPAWGNKIGYEWARKSRMKELANPCPYKGENKEELVLYAKEMDKSRELRAESQERSVDYYIFGHRHIELDLELASGARVVILGDCFRQWTYAAMDEQGKLELLCIQEQNN
ncbi:MAG: UDP-2,3-diacylglucosamine diphosphatase [Paludibacteraceae bacterium]|nr:UDP-2,3-diacylglucosamine diphosphatase [Paludibacteraceae bacterium]